MITNCANEMCSQPFRFFRGGKLFIQESNTPLADPSAADGMPSTLEHFWLCEHCAETMTLVVGQGKTPRVILMTGSRQPPPK
jgi:hypothetical protein